MQKSGTNRRISSVGSMPWWAAAGSQEMNSSNLNQIDWIGEHQKSEHVMNGTPEKEKQGVFHFSFSVEDSKNTLKESNGRDHQANNFQHFHLAQQKSYIELGLGQPMVYANHPLVDQCHGLYAVYGTQPAGQAMLPYSVATEDGPIYVNPKQYHGIMRRRKMRAKEGLKNRSTKDKPYVHESRHRHACRRARGAGGRFLNTKNLENEKNKQETKKTSDQLTFISSHSSGSEVLQSEGGNLNSSKEVSDCKSPNFSNSEVTSMYYSKDFDCFGINPGRPFAFHPLQSTDRNRQGSNWVTAVDGCCNLFKV